MTPAKKLLTTSPNPENLENICFMCFPEIIKSKLITHKQIIKNELTRMRFFAYLLLMFVGAPLDHKDMDCP